MPLQAFRRRSQVTLVAQDRSKKIPSKLDEFMSNPGIRAIYFCTKNYQLTQASAAAVLPDEAIRCVSLKDDGSSQTGACVPQEPGLGQADAISLDLG